MPLDLSLPSGLRDLLPDHSAHLAELSARLQEVFSRFGYRRVFLPTLERLDVVERGLSAAALADVMKFVEPGSGEVVAIRPDITPQIARLYAARPDALPSPARLCYDGPVLRAREARAGRPREVYQAGVEMLGAGGPAADAEMLVVLSRALARVGLSGARVEVGHARFAGAVVDAARLPERLRADAWAALARKDEAALAALARKA
ncbi:MAG TPA: ATP phosphoribosyltransferase regulatory subunit, partial [Anaeromyxobacter sp.]